MSCSKHKSGEKNPILKGTGNPILKGMERYQGIIFAQSVFLQFIPIAVFAQ